MALTDDELLLVYRDLYRVFPDDLHIARPLIRMLESRGEIEHARELALAMARRMLAHGRPAHAVGFLEMCRRLEHPDRQEVESLLNMARLTGVAPMELEAESARHFVLIEQLSDAEAQDFLRQASLRTFTEGEDIVRQGERSQSFYLVVEGQVQVHLVTQDGVDESLGLLGPGHFFGEFACLYNLPRTATVTARDRVLTLEFSALAISQLMQRFPLAGEYLMRTVQTRMIHAMTHSHPAFAELPETDRRWMSEESRMLEFPAGERMPCHGDHCFIVLHGTAVIRLPDRSGAEHEIRAGDMFGDVNRFLRLPAGCEVEAKEHLLLCAMPGDVFRAFMNAYAGFEKWVEAHGRQRHAGAALPLEEWADDD
ncbi:MAG: cyclic nucleotide-binding domain-containing protein [Mariprofundaceae bacterium]